MGLQHCKDMENPTWESCSSLRGEWPDVITSADESRGKDARDCWKSVVILTEWPVIPDGAGTTDFRGAWSNCRQDQKAVVETLTTN